MSRNRERAITLNTFSHRNMAIATAFLALSAGWTITQSSAYRNFVEGFSISRMVDGARVPRQKAVIIGEATPVAPVETAEEIDARFVRGAAEMQAEQEAEARALAASPAHPMSADYVHVPRWAAGTVTAENIEEVYTDREGEQRTRTRVAGTIMFPTRAPRGQ